jgi:type III pantothenate kinase
MLLFDLGNSRCKWAWVENGIWLRQGVLGNKDEAAWHELKTSFAELASPGQILFSNVADEVFERRLLALSGIWNCPVKKVVAQASQCGVINAYEHPAQLGSDRWAALIAAWDQARQACLVVNCGTATTVDALSDTGKFLGGLILPGIELMRRCLLDGTSRLRQEISSVSGRRHDFPTNTADAISSGVLLATTGAIRQQHALLAEKYSVRCIVSGGAADILLPHLGFQAERVENIVLRGMQLIGQDCLINTAKEMVSR